MLPDGQTWDFQYNDRGDGSMYNGSPTSYGTLTQVKPPSGGTSGITDGAGQTGGGLRQGHQAADR